MPTTQKLQQKQTKATQKVGGSAKKPVTKAMEGGKAVSSKCKTARGGSARGGAFYNYEETKERSQNNRILIKHLYTFIADVVDSLNENRQNKNHYNFRIDTLEDNSPNSKYNIIKTHFTPNEFAFKIKTMIDNNDNENIKLIQRIFVVDQYDIWVQDNFMGELKDHLNSIDFFNNNENIYSWKYNNNNKSDLKIPLNVLNDYIEKKVQMKYTYKKNTDNVPMHIKNFLDIHLKNMKPN